MSSRKEEERNEKVIRGLMKLPPNRRCINCNSLGPQYVCTNFWTFVCMTCSGIHREFTHRVKSVSMSKFTSQEVEALQEGGNQRARETFLKDWDPREQRLPDNSNVDKVRDFIKTVYVDKKFFSSKPSGKPPRDTLNNRNHDDETRRASSYHSYSQSPPYDYQYEERRYGKQPPALTKKPGSDRGMFRFLSASRLNDHVQEDTFANEVSNARVSDFSVNNGGDLFRSGTQTPPNLSNSSGSGKFDGLDLFSAPNAPQSEPEPEPQKFGGLDLFNAPNAPVDPKNFDDLDLFNAPNAHVEPKKFDDLDLFNAPNAPVEPKKFDDLDLFNAPNAPVEPKKFDDLDLFTAPNAPKSTTLVDLFDFSGNTSSSSGVGPPNVSVSQQFKAFEPSLELDLFTGMPLPHQQLVTETLKYKSINTVSQENDGWATFDMPWQAHAQSSQQDFSAIHSPWVDPVNEKNNQSWSSFEESTTPFETICTKSSEQVPVIADLWGTSEMNQADSDTKDVAQSHGSDAKSRNPFDFPSDTDLESTDMFLDMSSLQSALPNHNISTSWFPESAVIPYNSQDSLLFMAGQPPTMNIQAQGPVASIGGNPFG